MKEKGKDPALNTVHMCYINLIMLFGVKIGLSVFSINLHFLLEGKVLNRNGIFILTFVRTNCVCWIVS